jgi:hypothetical protein
MAGPSGLAVQGVGLRPFACWDCGFQSRPQRECLSLGSVVSYRSVKRADHWSRGVQPSVVCLSVIMNPRQ